MCNKSIICGGGVVVVIVRQLDLQLPMQVMSSTTVQARCTRYNIMWYSLSVTCDISVVFSGYSGFLHQYNWPSWYNWNIVESVVKYHIPTMSSILLHEYFNITTYFSAMNWKYKKLTTDWIWCDYWMITENI